MKDKSDILKRLRQMKELCVEQDRQPNYNERDEANYLMDQLSMIEGVEFRNYFHPVAKTLCAPGGSTLASGRGRSSGEFRSLGDFLQAAARSGTPGNSIDPRLQQRAATGL